MEIYLHGIEMAEEYIFYVIYFFPQNPVRIFYFNPTDWTEKESKVCFILTLSVRAIRSAEVLDWALKYAPSARLMLKNYIFCRTARRSVFYISIFSKSS